MALGTHGLTPRVATPRAATCDASAIKVGDTVTIDLYVVNKRAEMLPRSFRNRAERLRRGRTARQISPRSRRDRAEIAPKRSNADRSREVAEWMTPPDDLAAAIPSHLCISYLLTPGAKMRVVNRSRRNSLETM